MSSGKRPSVLEMSLWALTWPMFVELVLTMTLGLEDSFYLARISDRAAAAVGALLPVFGLCNMAFQTFAHSGASVASQLIGGERRERVNPTFLTMILLNALLGIAFAAVLYVIHPRVGHWMGLSASVYPHATEFLGLVGPMLFIQALRFAYASIVNACGRTRWNMLSAVFVNLANVSLNHLLTRGTFGLPRLGVAGIAWSTIVAQTTGLVVLALVVHLRLGVRLDFRGYWSHLRLYLEPILSIAVPSVVEPLSFQLNQLVLVGIVVAIGDVALATRTYTLNLIVFSIVWAYSIGLGTQIKIAHQVGARRFEDADRQLRYGLRTGGALAVVMMLVLSVFARPVYRLFSPDPEIARLGQMLMLMGLALEPARASNMIVGGSLRGSGDARFASSMSVLLTWGIAIPVAYLLALRLHLGLVGIWLAMICDEGCRGVMNFWRWSTGAWKTKGVLARAA